MIDAIKRLMGAGTSQSAASDCAACPEPPLTLIMAMTALGMLVGAVAAPVSDTLTLSDPDAGVERVVSTAVAVADLDD